MSVQKKSEKELANEKSARIMDGIAYWQIWCGFYRNNPHRFVKDYLNINLKLFQKILLYMMMANNYFMYIAARGEQPFAFPFRNNGVIKERKIGES